MAHFEQHCRDCKAILGNRHEDVNKWLDALFWKKGAGHRRYRHHSNGVRQAKELFGVEGAKAAVVHIVRDCGQVPRERDYDRVPEGVDIIPGFCDPPLGFEQHFDMFRAAAEAEIKRVLG